MNEAKFRRAMEGMTLIAKRVYDSVPIEELWDPHRIGAEMQRKGNHIDFQILRGCLKTLVDAGVIQEPAKFQFRRTPIRPPAILTSDTADTMAREPKMSPAHAAPYGNPPAVATPPTTKRQITPIDVLDELAKRAEKLAEMGKAMEKEAKQLAEDIEEAALALEEQRAAQAEQTELFERMRKVFGNAS